MPTCPYHRISTHFTKWTLETNIKNYTVHGQLAMRHIAYSLKDFFSFFKIFLNGEDMIVVPGPRAS